MISQAMAAAMRDDERSGQYGWVIDHDHLHDEFPDNKNEAGIKGPRTIPDSVSAALDNGEGRKFRMYDDDGELYYSGRMIVVNEDNASSEIDFAPLEDFGTPNAGATEIYYWHDDIATWECKDQEKAREYRSGYRLKVVDLTDAYGETLYATPILRDNEDQTGGWVML